MSEATARLTAALADRYVIERELGAGGMATVYLAHDVKHDRKVALKVLRPELAAVIGAERFLQEIKVTANLQHPNILALFDSGGADGFLFYVMPYIEGESLRDRIDREKQLAVNEAVEISRAVAAALEHAHRRGVIHRDIKPENILLHEGRPVVADFGIALAVSHAGGSRLTETGLSLGTPHYMSPEQSTGDRTVDARTDIYSLGAMLYEMLVGEPPFTGPTAQAVIAKVITEKAPLVTTAREAVPRHVALATHRALAKLPADRWPTATAFAEALVRPQLADTDAYPLPAGDTFARPAPARWAGVAVALAALLVFATAAAVWGWLRPAPRAVAHYGLSFAQGQEWVDLVDRSFALSPDGATIVYAGPGENGRQLWVKAQDQHESTSLAGTEGAREPVVSPDGHWILYRVETSLKKIPIAGGSSITIADSTEDQYGGAAWLDDGTIVYTGTRYHLRRVPAAGGPAQTVWRSDSAQRYANAPAPLPGGWAVLFVRCSDSCLAVRELWALDLRSDSARLLLPDVVAARYVETGHIVYVRPDGGVFAVPFDAAALEIRGAAVPVLAGVSVDAGIVADIELSANGTLLYATKTAAAAPGDLVWVSRDGHVAAVDSGWTADIRSLAISPDGSRVAVSLFGEGGEQIWIKQLPNGPLAKLTFQGDANERPTWTPDGRAVVFVSNRGANYDLYVKQADGARPSELLVDRERGVEQAIWSPDGRWLVAREGGADGQRDLLGLRPGVDTVAVPLVTGPFDEYQAVVSPDGAWLAYVSNESGRAEVYVRPFPSTARAKWLISDRGGRFPRWAHSGRELFYRDLDGHMIAVTVRPAPAFSIGERHTLFGGATFIPTRTWHWDYDVAPDDQRFLLIRSGGAAATSRMVLVVNWIEELKERLRQ